MKTIVNIIILAILIIISFAFGYYIASNRIKPVERIVIYNDTTTIVKEGKINYIKDTLLILKSDTVIIKDSIQIAELDTLTTDSLYLNVKYIFPPINTFSIKYKLPSKEIFIVNYEQCNKRKFNLGVGAGVFMGTKGVDVGILAGVYYQF